METDNDGYRGLIGSLDGICSISPDLLNDEKSCCSKRKSSMEMDGSISQGKRPKDDKQKKEAENKEPSIDSDDDSMDIPLGDVSAEVVPWVKSFHQMKRGHQKAALKSLLEIIDLQQSRQMTRMIEPHIPIDYLSFIPREIAISILSKLSPKDICRASLVCSGWYSLCNDFSLWRSKCHQYGETSYNPNIKVSDHIFTSLLKSYSSGS